MPIVRPIIGDGANSAQHGRDNREERRRDSFFIHDSKTELKLKEIGDALIPGTRAQALYSAGTARTRERLTYFPTVPTVVPAL